MIKQYLGIKESYPDAILFYRMGDFYEMFFEDAQVASRELEIALTSRNKNDAVPVPMCGVPHRSAQSYIARLIERGYKVAVCDQVEDPSSAKGLVKRDVVRVVTPGMIVDNELLDAKTNNYLLAVARHRQKTGVAHLDISTGSFRVTESQDQQTIIDEIRRIDPREVLVSESFQADPLIENLLSFLPETAVTRIDDAAFDHVQGRQRLLDQFNTVSLEGFGCEGQKAGVRAAGALLHYVESTQKQAVGHLEGIETYGLDHFLMVDELSCRNLELLKNIQSGTRHGTLLGVLDHTVTAAGGRQLRNWIRYPLIDTEAIQDRLDAVEEAVGQIHLTRSIRKRLKSIHDLERLGSKIAMAQCNARDLVALKHSLRALPEIATELEKFTSTLFQRQVNSDDLQTLAELIDTAIREDAPPMISEGGMIREGYSEQLDELIRISRNGKGWLAELEVREKEATGISSLKVRYNKVFGYYLEVPKAQSHAVPAHYVRKQTLVNAERYITDDLKSFEAKVLGAEEQRAKVEYELFGDVRKQVAAHNPGIQAVARFLARLDCLATLAEVADANDYHRPEINADGCIHITDGRHPVVEKVMTGERFVPNSIRMDNNENQIVMITGPNMAGKSTVLRQVALLVIMTQMGAFIPAAKASLGITDRIFTRVGALDNLAQGQSTFLVEMQETANILNNATGQSLVVMDEIGRGTSTYDGMSIAWAVAEYLHDLKSCGVKTLFATHYHELTELADTRPRLKNFHIAVKEWNDEIIFLRKLLAGSTNRSYGIQVARLAGIPAAVVRRAKRILLDLETENRVLAQPAGDEIGGGDRGKPHVQLNLFQGAGHAVIDRIKQLDVSTMTPLDALNCLSDIQDKIKRSGL